MTNFPIALAGQILTADFLNSMLVKFEYKINNTDRASTTTFAADPDLTMELEANSTYFVVFWLKYAHISAAEIKTQWTVPSGATGSRAAIGLEQGVDTSGSTSTVSGASRWGVHNLTTSVRYGARNSATNLVAALEYAVVTTTSAGTLSLDWAQQTSNATATRMGNGSTMLVWKLA